jgi:outer membrane protein assembly factor BamB
MLDARNGRFERSIDTEAAFGYTQPAIVSIVRDGRGGWFVEGDSRILHLRPGGSVDRSWSARFHPDTVLAYSGGRLYGLTLGFGSAAGRGYMGAVDAATGASLWTWPDVEHGAVLEPVRAFALGADAVYVAVEDEGIVALDPADGHRLPWLAADPILQSGVQALAVAHGRVYAGGSFGVVAVRGPDGVLEPWKASYRGDDVKSIVVGRATVFAGGRSDFGAFDAATGARRSWNAPYAGRVALWWLAAFGGKVYANFDVNRVGRRTCRELFAFDVATGRATPWPPDVATCVVAGAIATSGAHTLVSGAFTRKPIR